MKVVGYSLIVMMLWIPLASNGQTYSTYEQERVDEHIYNGLPGFDNVFIRDAYVMSYNYEHRIANWVAYHITPDYLVTPPRAGIFSSYRIDRDVAGPVANHEYNGLEADSSGLILKHLAPFEIAGGDRDNDGLYAIRDTNGDGKINEQDMRYSDLSFYIDDAYEINRLYEVNYLSNIVAMDEDGLLGRRGIWKDLEQYIQNEVVKKHGHDVWVIAGSVLGRGEMLKVGSNKNITVPPMFFKIVVRENEQGDTQVLAFLIPHQKAPHGHIHNYLVSVDTIEAMTGLDFFRDLDDTEENKLESIDTFKNWRTFH